MKENIGLNWNNDSKESTFPKIFRRNDRKDQNKLLTDRVNLLVPYKLLYISNKDLLYSIGNYIKYLTTNHNGKWPSIYITHEPESLPCTIEQYCKPTLCCVLKHSAMSDSLQTHELWPARLLCPSSFPGNNTGVGCHFLLQEIFLIQGWKLGLLCLLH